MKKIFLFYLMVIAANSLLAQKQDLLSGKYAYEGLKKILIPQSQWRPFPKPDDREAWSKADPGMMKAILSNADSLIGYEWPYIPATKSLLIERTGDREQYEDMSFKKREVLGTLLIAEIFENKGRFIDPIINGVWSICEESFWGVPAHLPRTKAYSGLMDTSRPFVELFSAETATVLAWVDYFLGDKLDAISPQIRKRIYREINYRIFEPLMTQPHGWMHANADGRRPNNWNPWICSNWLNTVLLLEKNDSLRTATVVRIAGVLDNFLNPYPLDGGCDEGPGYWGAAAASLYDNISLLNLATANAFDDVFRDDKIRNMGKFIYRAQIGEKYFLNFADADPQPGMAASMIYRFGKDIHDDDMMKFGAFYRKPPTGSISTNHFFRNFFELFMQDEFQRAAKGLPLPQDVWLPDIQVMISRDKPGTTNGFFVAAKGGNNDESHNHNDIGNFVVYYNGLPLLIDVGRGTYTRKTFSNQRYDIWYNCSDYHNVPTINGKNQLPGPQFRAENVAYSKNNSYAQLALDISKSYPEDAGINSWKRNIRLNRGKNVQITDAMDLKTAGGVSQHLMTSFPAEVFKPGELMIHYKGENAEAKDFIVRYDPEKMKLSIEKVKLVSMEDQGILEKWGDNIYRINFETTRAQKKATYTFEVAPKGGK